MYKCRRPSLRERIGTAITGFRDKLAAEDAMLMIPLQTGPSVGLPPPERLMEPIGVPIPILFLFFCHFGNRNNEASRPAAYG